MSIAELSMLLQETLGFHSDPELRTEQDGLPPSLGWRVAVLSGAATAQDTRLALEKMKHD